MVTTTFISGEITTQKADGIVFFLYENDDLLNAKIASIRDYAPNITQMHEAKDISGGKNKVCMVYRQNGKSLQRVFLVGLGKKETCSAEQFRRSASAVARSAQANSIKHLVYELPENSPVATEVVAESIIEGSVLGVYKFNKYFTVNKSTSILSTISICSANKSLTSTIKQAINTATIICKGVYFTRDLANAPNNEIYPESLAQQASIEGKKVGLRVTVLDKKKIQALKMGGLLAVNQGSARPPVFIVMEHNGGKKGDAPLVLVGKGVTFDTGGISIKPGAGMADMKLDMHGAASVIGAMVAIAELKLPMNVVGLVPATDNHPSGTAYVPGDIITQMNGKTVEVDNTDAEGRLILADALTYADKYKPLGVIDIATLTGAIVIALGSVTSGIMGNDASLLQRIKQAATRTNEYVCELPLHDEYDELITSKIADVKNSGGRPAGSITAALFLKKFIGDYPWVHVDIAGTGILPKDGYYSSSPGSGVGTRMFVDIVRNWKNDTV